MNNGVRILSGTLAIVVLLLPGAAHAQNPPPTAADPYQPITPSQRVVWAVNGVVAPPNLGVGVLSAGWLTALNQPEEWGRSWSGFGKRYLEREADVGIANTIEAGLGSLWGEDPRYRRSGKDGIWSRIGYAAARTVTAPGRDGRMRPAWARFAAKTLNTQIENTWLPPSARTGGAVAVRIADGFIGRFGGNLWGEFWPDVRDAVFR
jgi:hypothetical protein